MKKVFFNFVYNTGYQILVILIPIITTPYLARIIGADGLGRYSFANAIAYYFVMFVMLGLNNYGNRTIAGVRNDKEVLSKTFCEIYAMQFFTGIVAVISYVFFCIFSPLNNILQWSMLIYVISAIVDINWFFFGLEKFKFIVIRNIIIKILTTICIFVFVREKNDLYLYVCISLIGTLLGNIILWPALMHIIHIRKVKIKEVVKHFKPNLVLFIPIVSVSIYKYMDKIMLGFSCEVDQVGFYENSEKIIQIPIALVNSLGTVMLPKMSNLVATHNNKDEKQYMQISILIAMFCSSSLCFGLMAIAKEFVPLFYGEGYDICIQLFYILLPSCCFIAFASVIRTQYLIPHQKDIIYIKSVILGAFVNFVLNFMLITQLEAIGAAIATLIAEGAVCVYQIIEVRKILNVKEYIKDAIPFMISAIIMFIIIMRMPIFFHNLFLKLLIKVSVGIIIYFIVLFICLQFRKKELEKIKNIVGKIRYY